MSAQPLPRLSPQEYLAIERTAEIRSEYHDGEMFAMSGGSLAHSRLPVQLILSLGPQLRSRGCEIATADLRIQISSRGPFVYPDLTIFCDEPLLADGYKDTLLNPTVIFEVLSKSSEAYDRGHKFAQYRRIASLRDYVLVSQDEPRIEVFSREPDAKWALSEFVGLESVCNIPSVGCQLPLADIYHGISFTSEEAPTA